mmetsp:Transcript_6705/g.11709  ORF Transcript_6705/g.11709 Transcript_6705/m.11709 type:complete len:253 (-) Transcript_6705:737-1495(-)
MTTLPQIGLCVTVLVVEASCQHKSIAVTGQLDTLSQMIKFIAQVFNRCTHGVPEGVVETLPDSDAGLLVVGRNDCNTVSVVGHGHEVTGSLVVGVHRDLTGIQMPLLGVVEEELDTALFVAAVCWTANCQGQAVARQGNAPAQILVLLITLKGIAHGTPFVNVIHKAVDPYVSLDRFVDGGGSEVPSNGQDGAVVTEVQTDTELANSLNDASHFIPGTVVVIEDLDGPLPFVGTRGSYRHYIASSVQDDRLP